MLTRQVDRLPVKHCSDLYDHDWTVTVGIAFASCNRLLLTSFCEGHRIEVMENPQCFERCFGRKGKQIFGYSLRYHSCQSFGKKKLAGLPGCLILINILYRYFLPWLNKNIFILLNYAPLSTIKWCQCYIMCLGPAGSTMEHSLRPIFTHILP